MANKKVILRGGGEGKIQFSENPKKVKIKIEIIFFIFT